MNGILAYRLQKILPANYAEESMKVKSLLAIVGVWLGTLPVIIFVMLLVTGRARFVLEHPDDKTPEEKKVAVVKESAHLDTLMAENSRTFQALQQERAEMEAERTRMREQQDRIDLLQSEVEAERKKLAEERAKFEQIVSSSDSLKDKKIKDVAKMYGAMKPSEAAAILGTMNDQMVAKILKAINDDRQKAKILSLLPRAKAARLSRIIGAQ
jgi:flagellar motility protein MotE (MotC chaperone)